MATIIPLSFKDNIDDRILLEWLNDRFEEYGNKSNYIKYVLRKEMLREINKEE